MFSKLLSLLSSAKGAAAASVLATATIGGATFAVNDDARDAVQNAAENVAQLVATSPKPSDEGKPVVVAARNDADKKVREAFQQDQKTLEKLHSTHVDGTDRQKLEQLVNDADKKLRARRDQALDAVAALTLGREGRESPKPTASPSASPSASASADIHAITVDQAKVDAIVTAAIADMKKIVDDAAKAVVALPTFKPGENGNKPAEAGKPNDQGKENEAKASEHGKPSESPKR